MSNEIVIVTTYVQPSTKASEMNKDGRNILTIRGSYDTPIDAVRSARYLFDANPGLWYSVWLRDSKTGKFKGEALAICRFKGKNINLQTEYEINEYIAEHVMGWTRGAGLKWVDKEGKVSWQAPNFVGEDNLCWFAILRLQEHQRAFVDKNISYVKGERASWKLAELLIAALSL